MPGDGRNETNDMKLVIYVSQTMLTELDRRAENEGEEGESRGFIVRRALREYFRRHPSPERGT